MTYGPQMVIEGFFNAPDIPDKEIGGWYIQGHDADDNYQDFVITDSPSGHDELFRKTVGWHDWFKSALRKGDPLLSRSA